MTPTPEPPTDQPDRSDKGLVGITQRVAKDLTQDVDYGKLVEEEIEEYDHIEVTPELREGGIHAQKPWDAWFHYLNDRIFKTNFKREILAGCAGVAKPRILSLGCGYGGIELEVASELQAPYELVAVDLNEGLFPQAKERTAAGGLNIRWEAVDLNFVQIEPDSFDVIFAHASLHHVLNLEHVFEQVHRGLKKDGRFVVLDVIGKTRVLFWPENVEVAAEVIQSLPERCKGGVADPKELLKHTFDPAGGSGMEGIRQEDVPAEIAKWFEPVQLFYYGSFMRLVCTNPVIGTALDPAREEDRTILEGLFEKDLRLIREGVLRPTEMFGVFRRK